jgi:hypothetical protein
LGEGAGIEAEAGIIVSVKLDSESVKQFKKEQQCYNMAT